MNAVDVSSSILIHRTLHDAGHPYLKVSQTLIQDDRLSVTALGVLVYLLSNKDTWRIEPSHLAKRLRLNAGTVRKLLHELSDYGYVKLRERSYNAQGQIVWTDYQVYESPQAAHPSDASVETQSTGPHASADKRSTVQNDTIHGKTMHGRAAPIIRNNSNKKENDSPAEKSSFKTTAVLSPDGDAHADFASQSEPGQGCEELAVQADDVSQAKSLHDREESLPRPAADRPLAGVTPAARVDAPVSLIAEGHEEALSLIRDTDIVIEDEPLSLITDEANVGTHFCASAHSNTNIEQERGEGQIDSPPVSSSAPVDTLPRASGVMGAPRGGAGPKSDIPTLATHSHRPEPTKPASAVINSNAMLTVVAYAFKLPAGAYAGKIGQFFAGKISPRRRDMWAQHQPEQAAPPQEILALLQWYRQHPAYGSSCVERGGKLPSTPAILRDRLDEFRDLPDHAQRVDAAQPLLARLMRGETPAAPVTPPKPALTGPVESAGAYRNYDPKHDPAYQRAVDSDAAAAAFAQVFGR